MPKEPQRNKNFHQVARTGARSGAGKAIAVKDLLAKAGITGKAIAQHSVKQQSWQQLLESVLEDGLAEHVRGITLEKGVFTVLADTSGWAVRLRYALQEQLPALRKRDASVARIVIKVASSTS